MADCLTSLNRPSTYRTFTPMTDTESLHAHLNRETARIHWAELERMFAAGHLLWVAPGLDLVAVAAALAEDRADRFGAWLENREVEPLSDSCAGRWAAGEPELWAVVVAPWVLVQERRSNEAESP